jgi:hypothetical protein
MILKSLRNNAVLLILVIASPLLAQPAPTDPAAPDPAPVGDAVIEATLKVKLTVPEMQAKIAELDKKSEEDQRHVVRLQIVARKDKDVIRLNCINDKLLQIKALRNLIEAAKDDFEGAVASASADEQQHQFTKVTISSENVRVEANACAGEIVSYVGKTIVDWTGPDIPDDPSDDLFADGIEPPGYASPYN